MCQMKDFFLNCFPKSSRNPPLKVWSFPGAMLEQHNAHGFNIGQHTFGRIIYICIGLLQTFHKDEFNMHTFVPL